ncbi:hypothetical protein DQ04_04801050 [Trypanosoma grayi]|uniref:hypothetical protein n=1 Tax=Trypanosoma grayi TaxID=71804 RepID=UPI0004F427B2|nr:hypothetical protein DQ04_04801050 [Trypanosoma grayi]KEG09693.1 hypothetical protein DQ04_04801050 [Trypanosoma grayi]
MTSLKLRYGLPNMPVQLPKVTRSLLKPLCALLKLLFVLLKTALPLLLPVLLLLTTECVEAPREVRIVMCSNIIHVFLGVAVISRLRAQQHCQPFIPHTPSVT